MIEVEIISSVHRILQLWPFIQKSVQSVEKSDLTSEELLKWLCDLISKDVYMGVAHEDGKPHTFGVAYECTQPFSKEREFLVPLFAHDPKHTECTVALKEEFERWCKKEGIVKYTVITSRTSGATVRCFNRFGFKKSFLSFERKI